MGILSKLFGSQQEEVESVPQTRESLQADCPHTILMPRWDSLNDMGDEEKAIEFTCEACGLVFTPEEAKQVRGAGSSLS